jgi:polyisoprenoid-binding protein YceI
MILLSATARAAEAPLRIDPARSRVEIAVKATGDSFVGKLERYDAAIVVDPDSAAIEVLRARFAFRFADVKTGKDARDEEMHAWQDTARHPDGTFTLAALSTEEGGRRVATGTLVLHGRSREIAFPVTVAREGGLYAIDGEATLDTRDFGLSVIKKFLLLKVDPEVKVRFHLQGRAVPEGK